MSALPDDQFADAVTVAMLRLLERNGADREVMADISPKDQEAIYAAEKRHMDRRN